MSYKNYVRGLKDVLRLPARCMSQFRSCKITKPPKQKCRMEVKIEPDIFQPRKPCKTDAELRARPRLGYPRCDIPYKPECMELCFNQPRLDSRLYRPSKSLDRQFQVNWVDCVMVRRSKRLSAGKLPPEINRRSAPKPYCPRCKVKKCITMRPLKCRPLTPKPATSDFRCIKFPLCECPISMMKTRCKITPKTQTTCKRLRTRYPSYSECISESVPAPVTECHKPVSICEVWRKYRNRYGN